MKARRVEHELDYVVGPGIVVRIEAQVTGQARAFMLDGCKFRIRTVRIVTQTLQGMRVVRAYKQEAHEEERASIAINRALEFTMRGMRARARPEPDPADHRAFQPRFHGRRDLVNRVSLGHGLRRALFARLRGAASQAARAVMFACCRSCHGASGGGMKSFRQLTKFCKRRRDGNRKTATFLEISSGYSI